MEFVDLAEVLSVLKDIGISPVENGDLMRLALNDADETVHLHIQHEDASIEATSGAQVISVPAGELPAMVDHLLHTLHLKQVLLLPAGKWRNVFDAVAFSLAHNEDWQEIEHTATVALNSRDPLLCESGDYKTLGSLLTALFNDAQGESQTLMITAATAPFIVEVIPDGAMRITLGSRVLADEVSDAFEAHR